MKDGNDGYELALAAERERNSRQISAFRFFAASVVLALQMLFLWVWEDWTGAPTIPFLGYVIVAACAWQLRHHFASWAAWSGYTIAVLDIPLAFWLVRASWQSTIDAGDPSVADGVLMMLPLNYAGFIVMASLALDARQTVAAALSALVLQTIALRGAGHDVTFLTMVNAFTSLIAFVCLYWRDQTVRLVRKTSTERLRRERLGRYFSPQVASIVEGGPLESGAERREITVLFADLRDFTQLAERLDSREVVALLNRFHSAMVDVVFASGGTLDKYLGDGLMG